MEPQEEQVSSEFFNAAQNNQIEELMHLVKEKKIDINLRDGSDENRTALHKAAYKGFDQMAKELVDHGADINIEDNFGEVPLHIAADKGHSSIVDLLIEKGSNYTEDVKAFLGKK